MNKFQYEIYRSIVNLQYHIDKNIKPLESHRGICSIVYYDMFNLVIIDSERQDYLIALQEFKKLCADWPDGTGDAQYPVPANSSKKLSDAIAIFNNIDHMQFWLIGPYAKRRYDLLCYLIIKYKDMHHA